MSWETYEVVCENYHLQVVLQEGDVDGVKPRRLAMLDEDGEAIFVVKEAISVFSKLPLLAWAEIYRQIDRAKNGAYENGFKIGQESVYRVAARLNGADIIAEQVAKSLGDHY